MPEIQIKLNVSDEGAARLRDMDMLVVPVAEVEADLLPREMENVAGVLTMVRTAFGTLIEVMEARGKVDPDIRATVTKLHEPLRLAIQQFDHFHKIMSRAARVGRKEVQ